jgi:hypothetical protein
MNHDLPKPLRNALASQPPADAHPSPDMLAAFVERALPPVENEVVTHHLVQCADCREVVFLASAAAEEVLVEGELVAAAAAARHGMPARPKYVAAPASSATPAAIPRSSGTMRLRWLVPVAAVVLLVVGVLFVQLPRFGRHQVASLTVASNRPAVASAEGQQNATSPVSPQATTKAAAPEPLEKSAPPRTAPARAGKALVHTTLAGNAKDQAPVAPEAGPAPQPTGSQAADVIAGMTSGLVPAIRPQSSFAESESGEARGLQKSGPALYGKPQMAMRASGVPKPRWRVGPEGHLERSVAPEEWGRVLADQPVAFRAVAVVGNSVWAGGDGGTLFHSFDRGEHWSKVTLATNSSVGTGAIVSIRFDDSQHGVIVTSGGTNWVTSDGGVTWTTP